MVPSGFSFTRSSVTFAVIYLRLRLHDLKDPLRAGHGGEDGVHLLRDLGDGLTHLLGVLQKAESPPRSPVRMASRPPMQQVMA